MIQVGVARDRSHTEWPDYNDSDIRIIDDTRGWGIGFQVGRFGGFRYDKTVVPQARVLDHVKPSGFTAFVRPLEIIAAM